MKKVLIGAPCAAYKDYSLNDYFQMIATQTYEEYDVVLCVNGNTDEETHEFKTLMEQYEWRTCAGVIKKPVVLELLNSQAVSRNIRIGYAREKIRRYALDNGYDALLFLDTDTIPLFKDFVNRLLSWDVDAVSGLYHYKQTRQPIIIDENTATNMTELECAKAYNSNKLKKIMACGFGCIMLQRTALQVAFSMSDWGPNVGEDIGYCRVLYKQNIPLWFDARVICKHLGDPKYAHVFRRDMISPLIIENESQQRKV